MIAASKRCGPPQTFSHTLKSKYFAVSKWREAQTYEVSQPTFDSINSPASLLCQFTYCFVCKICMIFCQPDLRYKQNKLANNLRCHNFACPYLDQLKKILTFGLITLLLLVFEPFVYCFTFAGVCIMIISDIRYSSKYYFEGFVYFLSFPGKFRIFTF